jgi:lipopolysaccharide heptosyltransferase II
LSGWLSAVPSLRAARYDLAVDLQGLFRSAVMARLAGCPARIGFADGREGSPFFYTERVTVPTSDMHAVDRYLLVADALGAKRDAPSFQFRDLEEDRARVGQLLARHGIPSGTAWIAVNPSARWPTKRWAPERFAAAADELQRSGAGRIVLIGGPEARPEARAVAGRMHTPPVDLTGQTDVALLPALLKSAAVLLTNDSGPMHVAAAVGTPVVAVFGPTSPVRTGPYGAGHRTLNAGIPCSPCFSRTCRNPVQLECLTGIAPEAAAAAVRELLKQ